MLISTFIATVFVPMFFTLVTRVRRQPSDVQTTEVAGAAEAPK
jgi:hypothetical protein